MDNGDVYEILKDGTIHKVGNVKSSALNPVDDNLIKWIWVLAIGCMGLCIAFLVVRSNLSDTKVQEEHYRSLYNEEYKENRELLQIKQEVAATYPIIINEIEIGNVHGDGMIATYYGNTIYSYNTMYLKPKISYIGLRDGSCTLKVKLYDNYGNLRSGTGSPRGYSYSCNETICEGNNVLYLDGWGNDTKGYWSSGTYRIEVWYNDMCLKSDRFTIY
jgi:hypothetical protein